MKLFIRRCDWLIALLFVALLSSCSTVRHADRDGRFYHCVATAIPVAPANTWARSYPLERFEYGEYERENRPAISSTGYCNELILPKVAYLRYRLDGRVIEKRFDLSALTPQRVQNNTVEFYVDEDQVEVRLLTRKTGAGELGFNREVITRQ